MLSTKVVGQVQHAKHYFMGQDNYYTKDNEQAKERSEWWGKGAKELNLAGPVEGEVFSRLLKGKISNELQLGLKVDGEIKHRPGFDLTFSVPKSVSLLALLGGDERILQAVHKATDKALELIEQSCAQARTTKNGHTVYENTRNLVVAKFLHDISREADPQLHVHCVIMNMTKRRDGEWRSLASQLGKYGKEVERGVNGFIERVRHRRNYYGEIFRLELAYEMQQLGYRVVKTGKAGLFEIDGISPKTLEAYSSRARQIENYLQDYGFSGAKAAAVATLKTRQTKKNINRETLHELWQARATQHHSPAIDEVKACVAQALSPPKVALNGVNKILPDKAAKEAVQYAIDHLSETQTRIPEIELMNVAHKHALGENVNLRAIVQAIKHYQEKGELIAVVEETTPHQEQQKKQEKQEQQETWFMTRKLLDYEKEILQGIHSPHVSQSPVISPDKTAAFLASHTELSLEQKNAIKTLMDSDQQVGILEGPTGSGKTTLIKPIMELAKLSGYQTVLLTPTKSANLDLENQLKHVPKNLWAWLKSLFQYQQFDTVSRFIQMQENTLKLPTWLQRGTLIFVDHAAMLSTKQTRDLIHLAEKLNGRIIFAGDKQSLQGFSAGAPFLQMVVHSTNQATLTTNYRQQADHLKHAIADTLQGSIESAFHKIGDRIIGIKEKAERVELMAAQYAGLSQTERDKTLVLMPSKAQAEAMNLAIREALMAKKELSSTGMVVSVLLPKGMSQAQYRHAANYAEGQWARFADHFISLGMQRGEYAKIVAVHAKRNIIVLENARGKKIRWNPAKVAGITNKVEVFEAKLRELAVGERLVWKRNHHRQALYNGEILHVKGIQNNKLLLEKNNQKIITINLSETALRHFDYAYASTPYQKLHQTADTVIAYQNSYSRQSHQRLFYKTLGQALNQAWIYTEDKAQLLLKLQQQTGHKITVIDELLHAQGITELPPVQQHDYLLLVEKALVQALAKSPQTLPDHKPPEALAKEAVQYALRHLTEREAAFEHSQVMRVAAQHVFGRASQAHLQASVLEAEKAGGLVRGVYSSDGTRWTTQEAIELEKTILQLAQQDVGKLQPLANSESIEKYLQACQPKPEHAEAIRGMAQSASRVTLIQGFAGTGKTTMLIDAQPILEQVDPLLANAGHKLICLGPTHVAVKELKQRGMTAQTVDSFFGEHRNGELSSAAKKPSELEPKLVMVVDESSMLSNQRIHKLLTIAIQKEARIIFIGDTRQYPAIESGKPFALLQACGLPTFHLKTIERQKDPTLLQAVQQIYARDFAGAFHTLNLHIVEVGKESVGVTKSMGKNNKVKKPTISDQNEKYSAKNQKTIDDRDKRLAAIRDDYLSRDKVLRSQTLIVALVNEDRTAINALIRQALIERGEIHGKCVKATIFVPRDMTVVEQTQASNYQGNDKLRFMQADQKQGIEKNCYYTVREILAVENLLVLEKTPGEPIVWSPGQRKNQQRIEVYQVDQREMQAGDLIRWTRTDKKQGFFSPELMQVVSVSEKSEHTVQLKPVRFTPKGMVLADKTIEIDLNDPSHGHWDNAYAMTGYSVQSKTVKEVIFHAESFRKNMGSQVSLLVAATRATHKLTLYTDDKKALLAQISKTPGEKNSALEVMEKLPTADQKVSFTLERSFAHSNLQKAIEKEVLQKSNRQETKGPHTRLDAEHIKEMLQTNLEEVLERLLGPPKVKHGHEHRYGGRQGSLVVNLNEDKRGLWHDFTTGEGGSILTLVAKQAGLDLDDKKNYPKVLQAALSVLGISEEAAKTINNNHRVLHPVPTEKLKPSPTEEKSIVKYARTLVQHSQPVKGTLAERYLREHRGIDLDKFPACIRFHPAVYSGRNRTTKPALLVVARDKEHKIQAVQAIYLDERTANKADVEIKKQTWGDLKAGSVGDLVLSKSPHGPVFLAEGPETALSIFASLPNARVFITLGKANFQNVTIPDQCNHVVLCLDHDIKSKDGDKTIHAAAQRLLDNGKNVWIATPEQAGRDYNDVLKEQGTDAVKQNILAAKTYQDFIKENPSSHLQTLANSATYRHVSSNGNDLAQFFIDPFYHHSTGHSQHKAVQQTANDISRMHQKLHEILVEGPILSSRENAKSSQKVVEQFLANQKPELSEKTSAINDQKTPAREDKSKPIDDREIEI